MGDYMMVPGTQAREHAARMRRLTFKRWYYGLKLLFGLEVR